MRLAALALCWLAASCARSEQPARLALSAVCIDAEHGARLLDARVETCPAGGRLKISIAGAGSKRRHIALFSVRLDGTVSLLYPESFGDRLADLPSQLTAVPGSPRLDGAPLRLVALAVDEARLGANDPLLAWVAGAPSGSSHDVQGRADAVALDVAVLEIRR